MKVIINGRPSGESLKNCARVLEEIVNKQLNEQANIRTDKKIA